VAVAPVSLPNDAPPWKVVLRRRRAERLWALLEAERIALADAVEALEPDQWDAPSRCAGWKVRDVLGHLVHMAESSRKSLVADLKSSGGSDGDERFLICGRRYGEHSVPELCQRLRRAAASRYNGMPSVALSEVLIHGDDMLQPLGRRMDVRPESAVASLDLMRMVDRLVPGWAFHGHSHRGVRLVASDVGWASGRGPEVTGSALDLLALLANRKEAEAALSGPGVSVLRAAPAS
jgi:uncharacterized protein (TIGR03083 family)